MGFFAKLFGPPVNCPACGAPNAKVGFLRTQCANTGCRFYDPMYVQQLEGVQQTAPTQGLVTSPFPSPIEINYTNFRGEEKAFVADRESMRMRHAHLSVCVAPSGQRIALDPARIGNKEQIREELRALGEHLGSGVNRTESVGAPAIQGDFVGSFQVHYRNFEGEEKAFDVDPDTFRVKHAHVSVQVAPTGWRISLKRDQILNRAEVEQELARLGE